MMSYSPIKITKNRKFVELGTYLLVFLLPWQTRWIFQDAVGGQAGEYFSLSVYASDLLLITLLLVAVFAKESRVNFQKIKFSLPLGLLVVFFGFISIFLAENKSLAFYGELKIILAIGFVWLIMNYASKKKVIICFVASLFLPATLAIWQFLTQNSFANKWLGLAYHQSYAGGSSVIETYSNGILNGRWLRAYGSFDHPNILGALMVVGILLLVAQRMQARNKSLKETNWKLFAWNVLLIVFGAALFASFSRSAWMALFVGFSVGGLMFAWQKQWKALKLWLECIAIVATVFFVLGFAYRNLVLVRTDGNARLEQKSLNQRVVYLKQSNVIIRDNLLLGVGVGNYTVAATKKFPGYFSWEYQPVHNVCLLLWAELGLFAMLMIVALFVLLLRKTWHAGNVVEVALLLSFLPILMLDHWLWSLHFGILFAGLIIGIIWGSGRRH